MTASGSGVDRDRGDDTGNDAMGMSSYERQVLSAIENGLRREDPRLAAYLDQLSSAEPPPRRRAARGATERRRRRALFVVVAVVVTVLLAVLALAAFAPESARGGTMYHAPNRPATPCPGPNHLYSEAKCVVEPAHDPPDSGDP